MGIIPRRIFRSADEESNELPLVVQYGSTRSGSFRREVQRDNFKLPTVSDQDTFVNVIRALRQCYLPSITVDDFDNLQQMLNYVDDILLSGLKDEENLLLPRGFLEIPLVKSRLDRGDQVIDILWTILDATRLYVWLYRGTDVVRDTIPHLLELEESLELLTTRPSMGRDGGSRDISVNPEKSGPIGMSTRRSSGGGFETLLGPEFQRTLGRRVRDT